VNADERLRVLADDFISDPPIRRPAVAQLRARARSRRRTRSALIYGPIVVGLAICGVRLLGPAPDITVEATTSVAGTATAAQTETDLPARISSGTAGPPATVTGRSVSDTGRFVARYLPPGFSAAGVQPAEEQPRGMTSQFFFPDAALGDAHPVLSRPGFNISTLHDVRADATVMDLSTRAGARTTTVRGRPAVLFVPKEDGLSVVWVETPTRTVFVNTRLIAEPEVLKIANGVDPA
jgi:hypothetical protein